MTEGGVERAGAEAAEHVIARAVADAGVRDAEQVTAGDAARDLSRHAARDAGSTLGRADQEALDDYTSHHYAELNAYNREPSSVNPSDAADLERRSQAISTALGKLPPFEGEVYRGTNLPDDVLAKYRPGEVVQERAFTSSSTTDPFPGNSQFTIVSSNGKDIAPYSLVKSENEVLFDRGSRFLVLSHDVVEGVHYINLRELP